MGKKNSPACVCCCLCRNSDVLLLMDTTGSMGSTIANMKTLFSDLRDNFESKTCKWAVVEYRDFPDLGFEQGWRVLQTFTKDFDLVIEAVNKMVAGGGGDFPEQNYAALSNAGNQWETTLAGRTDPEKFKRLILWVGDAPSKNGFDSYPTRADTISALNDASIKVFALNVREINQGLDGQAQVDFVSQQATVIAQQTDGEVFHGVTELEDIEDALCKALKKK